MKKYEIGYIVAFGVWKIKQPRSLTPLPSHKYLSQASIILYLDSRTNNILIKPLINPVTNSLYSCLHPSWVFRLGLQAFSPTTPLSPPSLFSFFIQCPSLTPFSLYPFVFRSNYTSRPHSLIYKIHPCSFTMLLRNLSNTRAKQSFSHFCSIVCLSTLPLSNFLSTCVFLQSLYLSLLRYSN